MPALDFGVYNLLYAIIPVFSTLASFGLEATLRRYQPEYLRTGNEAGSQWLVRIVSGTRLATTVFLLLAILLTWDLTAHVFKIEAYRVEFAFFGLLIVVYFQSRILQFSLASHMLHRYSVGSVALLSIVKLVGYLTLAFFDRLDLNSAIAIDTAAFGGIYLFLFRAHRRHCTVNAPEEAYRPEKQERKRLIRYGLLNNFNDAGTLVLNSRSDNFFIAAILDPISVGIYSFYVRLDVMMTRLLPVHFFENVIRPLFFSVRTEDASDRLPRYFSLLINLNLLIQMPLLAYVAVYHKDLVTVVFGGKFIDWSYLLPIVVGFSTLKVINTSVTLTAQYRERAGVILASKVLGIYNVLALLVLLPVLGLMGAVIASGSAQVLKNVYIWLYVRHEGKWLNWWQAIGACVLLWGGVVAVCVWLKQSVTAHPMVHLLTGAFVTGLAVLVHSRSPALSASDRSILGSVLSGREGRLLQILGIIPRTGAPTRPDGPT
jgi:O-antigen/teichoic acid export membrane protein